MSAQTQSTQSITENLMASLGAASGGNKRNQIIAAMLNAQMQNKSSDSDETDRLRQSYVALRQKNRAMRKVISDLSDTVFLFAESIGACAQCFGEDRGCDQCEGNGVPGFFRPNPRYFAEFVQPAIERRNQYRPARQSEPGAHSQEFEISKSEGGNEPWKT